jgi:hypothetical protein
MRARSRAQRERAAASVRRVCQVGGAHAGGTGLRSRDGAAAVSVAGCHDGVAVEVDDPFAEAGVRGKDAVVAVAVDAWRWDQAAECGEKLEGREPRERAAEHLPVFRPCPPPR